MTPPTTGNGGYRSVVITGMSATTSIADTVQGTWEGLLDGKSGITELHDEFVTRYDLPVRIGGHLVTPPGELLSRIEKRRMSYVQQLAFTIGKDLWEGIGSPDVDRDRLGVCIGTGLGGAEIIKETIDKMEEGGYRRVSPLAVQMTMPNGPSAVVGLHIGARAGVITPISACASGSEAIAHAWRSIVMGDADMIVAGGTEGAIEAIPIACFSIMRAMSMRNDDPAGASRPFDRDRDGFVFGEAGALMVLESEEHALARGATILGRLLGAGITSDGFHLVAPDPEGSGAARAMKRAIETAGLTKDDISYVNAHATGTSIGDLAEAKAIHSAVGDHAAVYAPKSALGHSIGAVGALESVLTVQAIKEGISPPTLNLDNKDPEIDLDVIAGEARPGNYEYALNNSFGFGGHNVALAFGRY